MPQVVGIDHLVLSVSDLARSKDFYGKVLGFLGFKLKQEHRATRLALGPAHCRQLRRYV